MGGAGEVARSLSLCSVDGRGRGSRELARSMEGGWEGRGR